jgi:hypothetical protein
MKEFWDSMAEHPWVTIWVGIVLMICFSKVKLISNGKDEQD